MKNLFTFLAVLILTAGIHCSAADWDGISVPANAGSGKVWELDEEHSDDFNYSGKNSTFTSKWLDNHRGGWSGPGESQFSSSHSSVYGGDLVILTGKVTNISGKTTYCGYVTSKNPVIYPVYTEVRMRCSGINICSAFWLLSPDDVNEIDVTETYGAEDHSGRRMATNYHIFQRDPFLDLANSPKSHLSEGSVFLRDGYHRFGFYWISATEMEFYFDGKLVRQLNTSNDLTDPRNRFFDQAMHLIMNNELHSWKSNNGIRPSDAEFADDSKNKQYFDWIRTYKPVTGVVTQSPYGGSASTIPGTIEAEHYDLGGQNVAYYDNTSGNAGGYLRSDDVDIESRDGSNTIGWTADGEWLEYTCNVSSGTYDIDVRVASITAGMEVTLTLDGVTLGTSNVPNTGDWGTFQTVTISDVVINGGSNKVLRLTFDGGATNLNYIKFSAVEADQTPYGGSASLIPGTIEVENFDIGGQGVAYNDADAANNGGEYRTGEGVDIEARDGSYSIGWTGDGEWMEYTCNVTAGTYDIEARVAAITAGNKIAISLDGVSLGSVTVPNTGSWATFQTVTISNVAIAGGNSKVLRLTFDGGATNLNWVKFNSTGNSTEPVTVTIVPIHDAYLQGSTRYNSTVLRVEANNRTGYLMYDLSSINGSITNAELKLTCNGDAGNGTININLGNSSNWTESNLSTSNAPASIGTLGSLNTTYSIGSAYTWDLNESSLSGGGNVSLIVTQTGGNDAAFASKENSATEPQLVITYNAPKSAQPELQPISQMDVRVYPNPSEGMVTISCNAVSYNLVVFNSLGVVTRSIENLNGNHSLDLSDLSNAIYFIRIESELGSKTQKILIK